MSITIKTKYIVYNHSGTGVRHHDYTSANTVHNFPDNSAEPNEAGNRTASGPELYPFNGVELPFAFMSINGAKDGNLLYTSSGDYQYQVGTSNVEILVVYAPHGGIGGSGGGPGIWVDAFNVNAGKLSDDLHFIQVLNLPSPGSLDSAKTSLANQEGAVSSATAELIRASNTIDSGVPFLEWKQIMPTQQTINSQDFNLQKNQSGEIWIAFYQSPPPTSFKIPDEIDLILPWVDPRDFYDGGPHPMYRDIMEFGMGLALVGKSSKVNVKLRSSLLELASKQIALAAENIQKVIAKSIKQG